MNLDLGLFGHEFVVDNFTGRAGASKGIEQTKHLTDCDIAEPGDTIYVRKAWPGTKDKEFAE